MRSSPNLGLLFSVLLAVLTVQPYRELAGCTCFAMPGRDWQTAQVQQAFRDADFVFAGDGHGFSTLAVGRIWKGDSVTHAYMQTNGWRQPDGAIVPDSCVRSFGPGVWIVFGRRVGPDRFAASTCDPGGRIEYSAATLEILEELCQTDKSCRPRSPQSSITIDDVVKAPYTHIGQKTCWIGRLAGRATTIPGSGGRPSLEGRPWRVGALSFIVEGSAQWSAAALAADKLADPGERRICGFVAGAADWEVRVDGVSQPMKAPILVGATIELPVKK
jgi:hypothetical protein